MLSENDIERLFREHYSAMYRLAFAMLADDEDARDAVSDVFARLLDGYDTESINLNYLLICVRGQCLNRISRMKVKEKASRMLLPDTETVLSDICEEDKRAEKIWEFVDTELTEKSRDILRKRYMENMSCIAIANEMGISRQAVHKHILSALNRMRERFYKK